MFKKSVDAKSHQRLSGADRKKLKRMLRDKFPRVSDSDFDSLLPPKAEVISAKLQNRVVVYAVEGGFPLFFDVDGRGSEIYPTVFALWKVPEMLPSFLLKGGEVSRYIIGGADLMYPGICVPLEGLPSFLAGETWAVKVPGNPAPIAVGSTTMSSAEALKAGLRGKALRITHHYRDMLWESTEGHHVPNAGFLENAVLEDPAFLLMVQQSDPREPIEASIDQLNSIGDEEAGEAAAVSEVQEHDPASAGHVNSDKSIMGVTEDVRGMELVDSVACNESTSEEQQVLCTEDVDAYLDKCLLQALHTTVKDKDLPLPGSTMWSNHVLPCRPPGITLDIKKSSHKKLSKWLQAKASDGLISVKEDKYKKETMLISVNRKHPDFVAFKPEKKQEKESVQASDQAKIQNHSQNILEVAEIYKPSVHVNPIFASVGADKGKLYTAAEASDIVFKYVEQENLVKPSDKSFIVLNPTLCDALFKGAIKKGTSYPTEIHKKDLGSTFISRMQPHHIVTRGSESAVRKGSLKTIQIVTERRQGNKKVTKVSGIETFLLDAEALASELQKKFACSTTVAELPGKKGHEVLIQGGVIEDMGRHLVDQYGVPKRYIEILDKTRK